MKEKLHRHSAKTHIFANCNSLCEYAHCILSRPCSPINVPLLLSLYRYFIIYFSFCNTKFRFYTFSLSVLNKNRSKVRHYNNNHSFQGVTQGIISIVYYTLLFSKQIMFCALSVSAAKQKRIKKKTQIKPVLPGLICV